MYSREQIISEILRIANQSGGKTLSQNDFEINSMIPISTVRYYLGSWKRALHEAGLNHVPEANKRVKPAPKNSDELLMDLLRLKENSGEIPTLALIDTKGKYSKKDYLDRWKSINDAYLIAREKFSGTWEDKVEPDEMEQTVNGDTLVETVSEEKIKSRNKRERNAESKIENNVDEFQPIEPDIMEQTAEGVHINGNPIQTLPGRESETGHLTSQARPYDDGVLESLDGDETVETAVRKIPEPPEISTTSIDKRKTPDISFIPKTIKPENQKKKSLEAAEPIDFRGLQFAPSDQKGVIFLFGMICHELGFGIHVISGGTPTCKGKRCLDPESDQWEPVLIQVEFKSSDFKHRDHNEKKCDLIVCWRHDWNECPFEVLELRSVISQFPRDE